MAAPTNEQIWEALKNQIKTRLGSNAGLVSRRLKGWSTTTAAFRPAVFIAQSPGEDPLREAGEPPKQIQHGTIILLVNSTRQTEVATSTALNAFMDLVKAAFKPDQGSGENTIGGLVKDCRLTGHDAIWEGDIDGTDTYAVMALEIVLNTDQESSLRQFIFGTGAAFVQPLTAQAGGSLGPEASARLGALREIEWTADSVMTYQPVGAYQYAVKAASSIRHLSLRAKFAQIDGLLADQMFFGTTRVAGSTLAALDVPMTVPASGPFTVTPVVPDSGAYQQDLAVVDATTGAGLVRVSGVPATGQYAVAGGTYTFAGADAGRALEGSFLYTAPGGQTIPIGGPHQGEAPTCLCVFQGLYGGRRATLTLPRCVIPKLSLPVPREQFAAADLEIQALADGNGLVGYWCYAP